MARRRAHEKELQLLRLTEEGEVCSLSWASLHSWSNIAVLDWLRKISLMPVIFTDFRFTC